MYSAWGRWKERIYPTGQHPADLNQQTMCRAGLRSAYLRFSAIMGELNTTLDPTQPAQNDATARAIIATYDVLEWVHTFNEYLIAEGKYRTATDIDAVHGPYVQGAIGARNASHHGIRRVVGIVEVPRSSYELQGKRWVYLEDAGVESEHALVPQVRWVQTLPPPPLRFTLQTETFEKYLAGREVWNTFSSIVAFLFYRVDGETPPNDLLFGPAPHAPNIAPNGGEMAKQQDSLVTPTWPTSPPESQPTSNLLR